METITFVAIQFLLGRIAILCFLTKVGCFMGGEKHQLAGAGPIPFDADNAARGLGTLSLEALRCLYLIICTE
jgi:hypothetical protein